jgi:flagellar hook assembly protein FlgD
MGYYEPRWSAEEQTMVDLMELGGYRVSADINKESTTIQIYSSIGLLVRTVKDTEYEAIRTAFANWNKVKNA